MFRKIKLFLKQRKLSKLNKTGRIFMPSIGKRFVVIPFKWLSLIPIIFLTGASVFLLLRSDIFLAKNIIIKQDESIPGDEEFGQGLLSEATIREITETDVVAHSLWNIDIEEIKKKVTEINNDIIASVTVERRYPDTIEIVIDEHKPVALLIPEITEVQPDGDVISKKEYYLIDDQGTVFMKIKRSVALPEFHYPVLFQNLTQATSLLGFTIEKDLVYSTIKVIDLLNEVQYVTPARIEIIDTFSLKIVTEKDETFTLALHDNLDDQIERVKIIYEQSLYSGKHVKTIDTRFEKAVVTYKE